MSDALREQIAQAVERWDHDGNVGSNYLSLADTILALVEAEHKADRLEFDRIAAESNALRRDLAQAGGRAHE